MKAILTASIFFMSIAINAQSLYDFPGNTTSHVSSFENMNGVKGAGGKTNKTAKGSAFEVINPGESKTLLDINDQGIIQRIWCTVDQNPVMLRSLRLQMFWDGEQKPAVDVPLGDFFGSNLGRKVAYQSALFSTAEGKSFNCFVPMPFRKKAKVVLINESTNEPAKLFYDIDFVLTKNLPEQSLYFHAIWRRQKTKMLGDDIEILPKIKGKGRFIGMSVALNVDSVYGKTWWGEGEVKMYIDGDSLYPTIAGTGSEDYIGSGWGLGTFANQYEGCTVADGPKREYNFYRLHIPDAIYFNKDIKVAIQQIGGGDIEEVKSLQAKGVNLKPVSIDNDTKFYRLFELKDSTLENYSKGWVNFYRIDDYAVTAYFYLDKPSDNLPQLAHVEERTRNIKK
ncbi:MAG TPA: glycoside hydrolase family 172 protein [Puia sp.]|nr:glycoside hydrolase family 172 protein [Puia sp.]